MTLRYQVKLIAKCPIEKEEYWTFSHSTDLAVMAQLRSSTIEALNCLFSIVNLKIYMHANGQHFSPHSTNGITDKAMFKFLNANHSGIIPILPLVLFYNIN